MSSLVVKSDNKNLASASFDCGKRISFSNVKKAGPKKTENTALSFEVLICYEQVAQTSKRKDEAQRKLLNAITNENAYLKVLFVDETNKTSRTAIANLECELIKEGDVNHGLLGLWFSHCIYRVFYKFEMLATEVAYIVDFDENTDYMKSSINKVIVNGPKSGVQPFWNLEVSKSDQSFEIYVIKDDTAFPGSTLTNYSEVDLKLNLSMKHCKFYVSTAEIDGKTIYTVTRFDGGVTECEIWLKPSDYIIVETIFCWSSDQFLEVEVRQLDLSKPQLEGFVGKLKSLFYHS